MTNLIEILSQESKEFFHFYGKQLGKFFMFGDEFPNIPHLDIHYLSVIKIMGILYFDEYSYPNIPGVNYRSALFLIPDSNSYLRKNLRLYLTAMIEINLIYYDCDKNYFRLKKGDN